MPSVDETTQLTDRYRHELGKQMRDLIVEQDKYNVCTVPLAYLQVAIRAFIIEIIYHRVAFDVPTEESIEAFEEFLDSQVRLLKRVVRAAENVDTRSEKKGTAEELLKNLAESVK